MLELADGLSIWVSLVREKSVKLATYARNLSGKFWLYENLVPDDFSNNWIVAYGVLEEAGALLTRFAGSLGLKHSRIVGCALKHRY